MEAGACRSQTESMTVGTRHFVSRQEVMGILPYPEMPALKSLRFIFIFTGQARPTQIAGCRLLSLKLGRVAGGTTQLGKQNLEKKMVLSLMQLFVCPSVHPSFCPFIILSILPSSSFIHINLLITEVPIICLALDRKQNPCLQ